jgi:hypothetical protein
MFSKDSAGFGVPRGSLGKLQGFSRGVEQHGAIVTSVYSAPIAAGQRDVRGTNPGAASIRPATSVGPAASSDIRIISRSPGGLSNPGGMGPRGMGPGAVEHGGGSPNMGSRGMGSPNMGGRAGNMGGGMPQGASGSAPAGGHR